MAKKRYPTMVSKSKLKVMHRVNDQKKRVATKPIPLPPHVCEALGIPTYNYPARAYPPYCLGSNKPLHVVNGFCKTPTYLPSVGGDSIHNDFVLASGPTQLDVEASAVSFPMQDGITSAEGGFQAQPLRFPAVFMCGIPQSCREGDILHFFHGLDVIDVCLVLMNKSFAAAAFVVFSNYGFVEYALQRDGQTMDGIYIQVSPCSKHDFYKAVAGAVDDCLDFSNVEAHTNTVTYTCVHEHPQDTVNKKERLKSAKNLKTLLAEDHPILRINGPPYFADKNVITSLFGECDLSEDRIHFVLRPDGKPTGQIFIEFISQEDAMKVLARDKTMLGSRYLKIRSTTMDELRAKTTERKLEIDSHDMLKESGNELNHPGSHLQCKPQKPDDKQKVNLIVQGLSNIVAETSNSERPQDQAISLCDSNIDRGQPESKAEILVNKKKKKKSKSKKKSATLLDKDRPILRVHGPQYLADTNLITSLFGDCVLSKDRIHFVLCPEGKPTGQMFLEFTSREDAMKVLARDKTMLGSHYLKIHPATVDELRAETTDLKLEIDSHDTVKESSNEFKYPDSILQCEPPKPDDKQQVNTEVIKISNVPPSADMYDIIELFREFKLTLDRLHVVCLPNGMSSGMVYVEFDSVEDAKKILARDNNLLGSCYLKIYPATMDELRAETTERKQEIDSHDIVKESSNELKYPDGRLQCEPPKPDDKQQVIKICNVPPSADMYDIIELFGEFNLTLDRLHAVCLPNGMSTGVVYVEFDSVEDAKKALSINDANIHSNKVQLVPSLKDEASQPNNVPW